ncbi:MAG: hypothetical protein WEB60_07890 [Terrimicrobiaceae bacterium]
MGPAQIFFIRQNRHFFPDPRAANIGKGMLPNVRCEKVNHRFTNLLTRSLPIDEKERMKVTTKSKLDWKKLLAFKNAAATRDKGLTPANLSKVGDKAVGGKNS